MYERLSVVIINAVTEAGRERQPADPLKGGEALYDGIRSSYSVNRITGVDCADYRCFEQKEITAPSTKRFARLFCSLTTDWPLCLAAVAEKRVVRHSLLLLCLYYMPVMRGCKPSAFNSPPLHQNSPYTLHADRLV